MANFFGIMERVDELLKEFEVKALRMQLISSCENVIVQKEIIYDKRADFVSALYIRLGTKEMNGENVVFLFEATFFEDKSDINELGESEAFLLFKDYCKKIEFELY